MRVYDSKIQSWLTRDPSGEAGGLNLYEYDDGDPINKSDPTGLAPGEGVYQQEGRVKGAAIEQYYKAQGGESQVAVKRWVNGTSQDGFVDVQIGTLQGEVGPASPTGIANKLSQLGALRGNKGELFLYKQTATVPVEGDAVDFVRLSPAQGGQILDELEAGTLTKSGIWARASALAEGKVLTTTVSKSAAAYAGRVYINGKLIPLDYAAPEGEAAAGAGGKAITGGVIAGAALTVLTSPSVSQAAVVKPIMAFQMDDVVAATLELNKETRPSAFASLTMLSLLLPDVEYAARETPVTRVMTRRDVESLMDQHFAINEGTLVTDTVGRYLLLNVRQATPEEISQYRAGGQ